MKRTIFTILACALLTVLVLTGCAKQPTEEINTAKAAVDAVIAEGAEKYAAEDAKKINDTLAAAMNEIDAQEGKMMKNFGKAKELLAQAKADAEALKTNLPAKKEEAKLQALAAQEAAVTAVKDAKSALAKAPQGKGSRADIEAMKADLKGLEDVLIDVQTAIDTEDYSAAYEKANSIKEKSAEVSAEVSHAMEKVRTR